MAALKQLVTIRVETGHESTIESFITSMQASGFKFRSRSMQSLTGTSYLVFERPCQP